MGHERISFLPKTEKWENVVKQITDFGQAEATVSEISKQTITNVRSRFRVIQNDRGVLAAFQYLVYIAVIARSSNPWNESTDSKMYFPKEPSAISLTKAAHSWVNIQKQSFEYGHFAQASAGDALASWFRINQTSQIDLLDSENQPLSILRKASNGRGFCELSRLFFAKFTERYLNYFLEREASSALPDIAVRKQFKEQVSLHVDKISRHAFETAKITQSFAAGWFNKNAKEGLPSEKQMRGFLSIAFGKICEELLREVENK